MTTLSCTLALALAAAPVAPEGPVAPPAAPSRVEDGALFITAGVSVFVLAAAGVGVLAAGLVLGDEAATARNAEVDRLNAAPAWPSAGERARLELWHDQGRQANATAIAGGVLAGAAVLVGGVLLGRGLASRRRARAALGPGPGAGLRLHLSF